MFGCTRSLLLVVLIVTILLENIDAHQALMRRATTSLKFHTNRSEINIWRKLSGISNSVKRTCIHSKEIYENLYFIVYHNALQCGIDLFKYWKRETSFIFIDNSSGLERLTLLSYMKKQKISSEVQLIVPTTYLKEVLMDVRSYTNFVLICDKTNTDHVLSVANSLGLLSANHTWTILSEHIPSFFTSVFISPRTQITLLMHQDGVNKICNDLEQVDMINIFDVFYNFKKSQVDTIKFATWTLKTRLFMLEDFEKEDNVEKLQGRKMRTISFQHAPYSYISNGQNNSFVVKGLSVKVLEILLSHFNVIYENAESPEYWGYLVNGSFTGVMGILHNRQADLSMNMFLMSTERLRGLRFIGIVGKGDLSLAYNRPEAVIPPTNYVLPFSISVWTITLLTFITILFSFAIGMIVSPSWQAEDVPSVQMHSKCFRLITGSFYEEVLEDPPGLPARVLYASLLIATTLIFIMYTSVFTSFLAYRDLRLPILNLKELVQSDEYIPIALKNVMHTEAFKKATSGVYRDLWTKMTAKGEASSIVDNYTAAVSRMYSGRFVLAADGASIIAAMDNNCSVELIRTTHMWQYAYVVGRFDFPFSRIFYTGLTRLMEGGIMRKIWDFHMLDTRPPCSVDDSSLTFGIEQVSGVFFIWACGVVLTFCSLTIEKIIYNRNCH